VELLKPIKTNGCKRASIQRGKPVTAGNTTATVINPYMCAGDIVAVEIKSNGREKIPLKLPRGWKADVPDKVNGNITVFIQTAKATGQRATSLKLIAGSNSAELQCHLVRMVK
jgi:hypothetical protein|tara:strand:+ start:5161 stop:5499 length:339 start_codon:yes stop_codon:yes gene_type:complete